MTDKSRIKLEKLKLLQEKKRLIHGLPHIHYKWYPWAREFFESRNKMCFLTAGNQASKSSSMIRKCIHWATETSLWPSLWRTRPNLFVYFYPSKDLASIEFANKWSLFMPKGEFKDVGKYSWEEQRENKKTTGIFFKESGVEVLFKSYSQTPEDLQASSVYAIFCDEEMDPSIYDEVKFRLSGVDGYYNMAFTATTGNEFWRQVMEERGTRHERFPNAYKKQVSLYDCLQFEDGTPGHWDLERVERYKAECGSDAEVQKRIYGRFVVAEGRMFDCFSMAENVQDNLRLNPKEYSLYAGIDAGSGSSADHSAHPAAIVFVAVNKDYTKGYVVDAWRGDKVVTDATYIIQKYEDMRRRLVAKGFNFIMAKYDHAARDLHTVATQMHIPVFPADKNRVVGIPTLNALFKNKMLTLEGSNPEVMKLAYELSSLKLDTAKTVAKDDLCDATRYTIFGLPWNFKETLVPAPVFEPKAKTNAELREEFYTVPRQKSLESEFDAEFDEWNEAYGG